MSIDAHQMASTAAGFQRVRWHNPELSTEVLDEAERLYGADFLEHPPIVFIEGVNSVERLPRPLARDDE